MNHTVELVEKNKCTGCGACMQKCPKGCIRMTADSEGFLVPAVDANVCVNCGICLSTCPQMKEPELNMPIECFGAKHNNDKVLLESSSGGMFTLLAEEILRRGGDVFGCGFRKDDEGYLTAQHFAAENIDELAPMRGSKYVQSDTVLTYQEARKCLRDGRWILYTGTPCEIAGLKSYLSEEYERLITVDLICHGVPSPELFRKYLKYCSNKVSGEIQSFKFRDKSKGCGMYYYYCYKEFNTEKIKSCKGARDRNGYFTAFSKGDTYREACYQCPYAQMKRVADITIGDYFAIDFQHPEFDASKGVSSLLVNTPKGSVFVESLQSNASWLKVELSEIVKYSSNMQRPSRRTENRNIAYKNIDKTPEELFDSQPYTVTTKAEITAFAKEIVPDALVRKLRAFIFQKSAH